MWARQAQRVRAGWGRRAALHPSQVPAEPPPPAAPPQALARAPAQQQQARPFSLLDKLGKKAKEAVDK